jgi:acyl-CoA synthetase (NDP forming)
MVPAGVETMVTVEAHPSFGPVVAFGLGGAFADAIADRSARSLPLTDVDVADLVAMSRAAGALAMTGADLERLHDLLLRVGRLVDDVPEVERMRLNPVLVSAQGAWVLDAQVHERARALLVGERRGHGGRGAPARRLRFGGRLHDGHD